jgi:primary-amine oxidase
MPLIPHPLSALSLGETNLARDIVLGYHADQMLYFRQIILLEPPKEEVMPFLELEHSGKLDQYTPRPQRLAKVQYDAITKGTNVPQYQESIIDLRRKERVEHRVIAPAYHASLTM